MKTREFWTRMEEFIFFTSPVRGWEEKWDVFMHEDEPVTSLELAKKLVREQWNNQTVGLAEFDQMKVNKAQWDNM